MALLTEKSFEGSSVHLNYAEGSEGGAPLLLLHGFTDRWQTWLDILPALMLRWHVHALDHRGHGRSGYSKKGYPRTSYVSDAAEFLRDVVGTSAVLMGHSLGAMTAVGVAAGSPELVRALVLEEPLLLLPSDERESWDTSPFQEECRNLAKGMSFEEIYALERRLYPETTAAESRERARHLSFVDPAILDGSESDGPPDMIALLANIEVPTLLVHGDAKLGGIVSEGGVEQVASTMRDLTVARIEGIGHDIHWRRTDEFRSVVMDFLESLERPERH